MENTQKSQVEKLTSQNEHAPTSDGISMPTDSHTHGVTHMVAPGPVADLSVYHKMDFHDAPTPQGLLDYLARPVPIDRGAFASGVTSPKTYLFYPTDFTGSVPNTAGAYGMRATVCFRFEVAAAPQAQGIIRMAYEYLPYAGTTSKASYRPVAAQLPGAEINLRSASAVEVKVPFVSDRDFWPLVNGIYTNNHPAFRFSIFPYAPVAWDTTTVSSPTWTLYRWYEDVELIGRSMPTVAVTPQAGHSVEDDVSKVSTWFRYGSKVATYASTVPALTSFAAPVSWVLSTASKVAAHYGWSKPNEGSYMGVVGRSFARGINTCADSDFANPLGYYSNNEIAVLPGFAGSNADEMSLCYLTCKPGLIASCQLSATDTSGAVKWVTPVAPACFVFQSSSSGFAQLSAMGLGASATTGVKPGYFPSPIAYFSSFFERWRGDIIFRFKFNTTKFHAGKLLIGYVPGEDVSDGVTAGGFSQAPNSTYRYDFQSVIIDLRNTTEYDFVVPFTYPACWCSTGMTLNNNGASFSTPNTGSVFVRIIDPLYGPDNVPQTCDMLVEVLGTCGLELTQPIASIMLPLDVSTTPVVVAQSGGDTVSALACVNSTGERILSIKQLMARPYWTSLPLNANRIVNNTNLAFYSSTLFGPATGGKAGVPYIIYDSIINRFQPCFSLVRGGLVVRFLPQLASADDSGGGLTKANAVSSVTWAPDFNNDLRSCGLSIETDMVNQVRIPYYGKNSRSRTSYSIRASQSDLESTSRVLAVGLGSASNNFYISGVSAADDLQLGAFNGVPACVTYEPNNPLSDPDPIMFRLN